MNFKSFEKRLIIDVDTSNLRPQQIRQLKSLNTLLMHIMTTEDEGDFFETSKEVMERVVALVKNANFASELKAEHDIPYAEQAIEYSLDAVNDILFKKNIHLDN